MNKVMVGHDIGRQLQSLLGLPKNLISFELRAAVNEVVTVKCEYCPDHSLGFEAVFAEYELVRRAPAETSQPPLNFDTWMRERTDAAHAAYMARHAAGGVDYASRPTKGGIGFHISAADTTLSQSGREAIRKEIEKAIGAAKRARGVV